MNRIKYILFILLLFLIKLNYSQNNKSSNKINFYLQQVVDNPQKSDEQIHLFVRGDIKKIEKKVKEIGGFYKYGNNTIAAVILPLSKMKEFAENDFVQSMEINIGNGQVLNDSMLSNSNVIPCHQGITPLVQAYDGEGVILGFIDTGIEIRHPDFKDKKGKTRILYIWDQRQSYDAKRTPQSYGYGQVWDSTDINTGKCTHIDTDGHGTNVAGAGAGNGLATGNFTGVAPKAEIIMVATNFSAKNWNTTVSDAVDFIFKKADALGKPCAINISLGSYTGSHDGQDAAAQIIDGIVAAKKGRVIVSAAGNGGKKHPIHLGYDVTSDTSFTWFKNGNSSIYGITGITFDLWADSNDIKNVQFAIGADKVTPYYSFRGRTKLRKVTDSLGGWVNDSIMNDTNVIAYINTWSSLDSYGKYFMHVRLSKPDSNTYYFRFITTGSGRFDIWSADWIGTADMVTQDKIPSESIFPDIIHYKPPDKNKNLVNSWACSPNVITVANYNNRNSYVDFNGKTQTSNRVVGDIAPGSSMGPTRQGMMKPDIASPGDNMLSASALNTSLFSIYVISNPEGVAQGGKHATNGGTSMASPGVAGIAALYLQKCPDASHLDVKNALTKTTKKDNFTDTVPNYKWGYGKADAFAALSSAVYYPKVIANGKTNLCEGEVLQLSPDTVYTSYKWSTNETSKDIVADTVGNYYLSTINSKGCRGFSDTVVTTWFSNPPIPVIKAKGTTTICGNDSVNLSVPSGYFSYLWSTGSTKTNIDVNQNGSYYALVKGFNDCEVSSDTVNVAHYPYPDIPTVTQNNDTLYSSLASQYQWYFNNIKIDTATQSFYIPAQTGSYSVEITDSNTCTAFSDTITILLSNKEDNFFETYIDIYPNPSDGLFYLAIHNKENRMINIRITNLLGQTLMEKELDSYNTITHYPIHLRNAVEGIYFLHIYTKHAKIVKKIDISKLTK